MINNMNTKLALVAAFVVIANGCAMDLQENPDYAIVHGSVIFAGDYAIVNSVALEAAHEAVIATLVKMHPEDFSEQALRDGFSTNQISIYFVDSIPDCSTCLGRTFAYATGDATVLVRIDSNMKDLAQTGLTHELIHVAENFIGVKDKDHNYKDYFHNDGRTVQENSQTVESKVFSAYMTCNEDMQSNYAHMSAAGFAVPECSTWWH